MLRGVPSVLGGAIGRFSQNPLLKRVIRNSGYLFSASTASAGLSMIQSVLAARLLGVEGFGVLGAITVFASVINRLTSFRMGELVISYVGRYTGEGKNRHAAAIFKVASLAEVGSSFLAYALLLVLAPLGARLLVDEPGMAGLFALYGLIVLANLMAESATGLLQILNQYRAIAVLTVAQSALTLTLILATFLANGGLSAIVIAYLLGKAVWGISVSLAALRQAGIHWGAGWWRAPIGLLRSRGRELVRFALSTNLTSSLTLLTRDSQILWLSAFSNPLQVGYYKVTLAILNFLFVPIQPLINTTYREVAKEIGRRQWENVRYLLRSGSLFSMAFSLPASIGLILFGPWVVSLWGREFLPTSYHSLLILLVGVTVINVFYWNRTVLLPLGLPAVPTLVYFVAAVLNIAGIVLLVPRFGAVGMASLLSAFFLVTTIVLVWLTRVRLRYASQTVAAAAEV